jgi:glycosyltransferase involved in cell wall biosynthesis
MTEGVSFVVCCHNSARLLPETLARLAAQQLPSQTPCEVILVDNSSTDATAKVASKCWPCECKIPLQIVSEPTLGLSHARLCGIRNSSYSIVCFVDDDNRLNLDWAQHALAVMTEHPEVGACGGQIEAQSDVPLPRWFECFQSYYAVGKQAPSGGDVTETRGYLWGAGLCLRKSAWKNLVRNGFCFLLSDRMGQALSAGADAELCYALRLTGWRLWYEPRLSMSHFLPGRRLQWKYLRHIKRGFGAATAILDSYEQAVRGKPTTLVERLRHTWSWQTFATIWRLLRKPIGLLRINGASKEGEEDVLQIEMIWGRLLELLRHPRSYGANYGKILKVLESHNMNQELSIRKLSG